ncbi:zinc finger, CCHC-type containing protein [Tanacetum coccineum]
MGARYCSIVAHCQNDSGLVGTTDPTTNVYGKPFPLADCSPTFRRHKGVRASNPIIDFIGTNCRIALKYLGLELLGVIMRLVSFTTHEAHSISIAVAIDCTYYEAKGFKKRKVAAIDALVFPLVQSFVCSDPVGVPKQLGVDGYLELNTIQMDPFKLLKLDLDEEVYMKQPEGFVLPDHENKVCKLKKSLYGLKQAPKQWHDKFDKSILSNGFTHNSSDRCIYSKFTKDYGVILCLYVDDILIVGTNMESINETKKFLSLCFQMKDMNEVDTILGIKVKRHSGGYALNQYHYIDKIINQFQHLNIEEENTPYELSCKLVENNGRVVAQIKYASAIGCLIQDHWKAIGRVFGYLKRTRQLALYYDRFPAVLKGYLDASWITGSSDSKSTTDPFTKDLPKDIVFGTRREMGLKPIE